MNATQAGPEHREIFDPENTLFIELTHGDARGVVVITLWPDVAPRHVERIKALARGRAYDDVVFHRVIHGFVAQTGDVRFGNLSRGYDPERVGMGGSTLPDLSAEFSDRPHLRGTVGAARARDPNSANSQFFINLADNHFLDGQYTVFGQVAAGMEHIDAIARGEPPARPDRMLSVRVAADVQA